LPLKGVIRLKRRFGESILMGRIVYTNGNFSIWFEKCLYKISKCHGLSVIGIGFAKCYVNDIVIFNMAPIDH
jgi:hypothetical protein